MPSDLVASAVPRKRFFLEMFTRDISLEGCILDLIDNAIDGYIRRSGRHIVRAFLDLAAPTANISEPARITLTFSEGRFEIEDDCGGIDLDDAVDHVFNFGYPDGQTKQRRPTLGAYGVGLKRAIFKIGDHFEMISQTPSTGFRMSVNIREWAQRDRTFEDWTFPLERRLPSSRHAGTSISVKRLSEDVRLTLRDPTFEQRLVKAIGQTYALFLDHHVLITVNGTRVTPEQIPVGESKDVTAAHERWTDGGVDVHLLTSLAARGQRQEWRADRAGWYVLCNGRVVVAADHGELTGWGTGALPAFHSKYRGFVGVAFFASSDPLALPWTTTKRELNRESPIYQRARSRMSNCARPVIHWLDRMYPSEAPAEAPERQIAAMVEQVNIRKVAKRASAGFRVRPPKEAKDRTIRIQYDALLAEVEAIRKHMRDAALSGQQIGRQTFEYYMQSEGLK